MKKSLLALAALSAIAGAAQAQSSVTVYGILDVGYIGSNSSLVNGSTQNASASANYNYANTASNNTGGVNGGIMSNNNLKQTQSVLGQSAEQTSRLGFKGTEDLGGGTSAFFTAEFTVKPQDQTLSGTTNGGLANRQTFVGMKKNGLGDFAVGTQYTPLHIAVSKTDPGQQNNMTGSVIYTGQADSGVVGAYGGNQNAYTSRQSNSLTLNSDIYAGFQAHAMAVLNNNNSTAVDNSAGQVVAGGNNNTNGWALGADYSLNKFFVTANYTSLKQLTSACNYSNVSPQFSVTCTGGATANPSQVFNASAAAIADQVGPVKNNPINIQDNQAYVGATYDFGILKAYASWIQRKATDTANSGIYQKRSAEQIGVRSFVTPTVETWASAGVGTFTPMGINQNSAHFNAWQLGSNYWLSKRTNLYAIYGQYAQANATYQPTYNTSGVGTAYNTNMNVSNYAIGVRHTF